MPLTQQYLEDLPDEILVHIFSFLPTESLVQARTVSKKFKQLIDFHSFKHLLNLYFPFWNKEADTLPNGSSSYTRFTHLFQKYLSGLSAHLKRFFYAVFNNHAAQVKELLQHDPSLLTAECASGHTAIYFASAFQLHDLFPLLSNTDLPPSAKRKLEKDYLLGKDIASYRNTLRLLLSIYKPVFTPLNIDLDIKPYIDTSKRKLEEGLKSINFDSFYLKNE